SPASRTRPPRHGTHRTIERARMDDCAAAAPDEIARRRLSRNSRRITARKPCHVVSLARSIPVGCDRAQVTRRRDYRTGGSSVTHLYTPVLVVHVLVAVLGLGSIASVALMAATARQSGRGLTGVAEWLGPLLRWSAVSLATMLITGVLLDVAAGGAFRKSWWFRGSGLLLLATGALHGQARRAVRRGIAQKDEAEIHLRRVARMGYGMCALIAAITVLMEVKPF